MASDTHLHRRVTRLENDTEALYDLVTEVKDTQHEHTRRLDGIDTRLDGIDTRLDGIDTRLDGIQDTLVEVMRRLPEPE